MAEDRKKPSWTSRIGSALTSKPVMVGAAALAGAAVVGGGAEYLFGDSLSDQHSALNDIINKVQEGTWFSNSVTDSVSFKPDAVIELHKTALPDITNHIFSAGDHAVAITSSISPDTTQLTFSKDAADQLSSVIDSKQVVEAAKTNTDLAKVIADFKADLTDHTVTKDAYNALIDKLGGVQGYNIQNFTIDNPPPGYFSYTAPNSPEMGAHAGKEYFFHNDLAKAFEGKNQGVVDFLDYASKPIHTSGFVGGAVGAYAAGTAAAGIKDESNRRAEQTLREDPNYWRAQIAEEIGSRGQGAPTRSA